MARKSSRKKEGNVFDRILRENVGELFLPLLREHLKVRTASLKSLPDKIQSTEQRETDAVFDVELKDGSRCLVHLEFESESS